MTPRPPSHKIYERRFKQHARELKTLSEISNPPPVPVIVDRSHLCRECKRRGARKDCPYCKTLADQRARVMEALAKELQ